MRPFGWLRPFRRLDNLSDEIQSHLEEKTDALVAAGLSREEAEREARRAFGNVTLVRESAGDVWRLESFLENLGTDVRYVLRGLVKKPGYAIAVILTLALGIGANAVVFALVNAAVLRPLPYPGADRLISLSDITPDGRVGRVLQDVVYDDWRRMTRSVEASAAYDEGQVVLGSGGPPERVQGMSAMASYFAILRVRPLVGRLFTESEAQSRARVVVLSEQLWRSRFQTDSRIVGRSVKLDGQDWEVIGVLPAAFVRGRPERYWQPLRVAPVRAPPNAESGEFIGFAVLARLREGVPLDAVRAELATVFRRSAPGPRVRAPVVMTLHERRHGETRRPLMLLYGAVGVLLLTACANLANLALARAARREREFAMRRALGATRGRLVRFVLLESFALAAAGAALGLVLVRASLSWFVGISPGAVGSAVEAQAIGVNGELVAYASGVALLTAVLFGLVPALTAARAPLNHTLTRGAAQAAGSRRQALLRRGLVTGELAVALVFLTGAGLVAKTFWRVASVDPGFRPEKLIVANIELGDRYKSATAAAFFDELMARVRGEPGVQSISYSRGSPLAGRGSVVSIVIEQKPKAPGALTELVSGWTEVRVDTAYFRTIGAQLTAGRLIGPEDRRGTQRVAVVTEEFVRLQLKGAAPLGQRFGGSRDGYTIVGVIKDIARARRDGKSYPLVFVPLAQTTADEFEQTFRDLIVRTTGEPGRLEAAIRSAVQTLDPAQPAPTITTMKRSLAEIVAPRKFTLVLLGSFAALALGLAVIGLYSVLAYLVAERTREIGIRVAMGADAGRVTRMVLGQGLWFALIGILLGGAASLATVRVLRSWMYETSVYDAPTFFAVAALLAIVALVASWLPARRASRVDPLVALRAD